MAMSGAVRAFQAAGSNPHLAILHHARGDWGDVSAEQRRQNDAALKNGGRIMSQYSLPRTGAIVRVFTEAERHMTVVALPEEYW